MPCVRVRRRRLPSCHRGSQRGHARVSHAVDAALTCSASGLRTRPPHLVPCHAPDGRTPACAHRPALGGRVGRTAHPSQASRRHVCERDHIVLSPIQQYALAAYCSHGAPSACRHGRARVLIIDDMASAPCGTSPEKGAGLVRAADAQHVGATAPAALCRVAAGPARCETRVCSWEHTPPCTVGARAPRRVSRHRPSTGGRSASPRGAG